jgi:pimeloyl-[acyl-carrier protein] methyl ester esterase
MKTVWLRKDGAAELLLFFNGWGMDCRIADYLLGGSLAEGFEPDLLVCYDYRSLLPEPGFMAEVSRYAHITVIAWSFGVWVAQQVELPVVERAIAINGTLYPVHDTLGIPTGVFQATLSSYSEESRHRFNRRMCGSREAFACFSTMSPDRETAEQKEELERLNEHFQKRHLPDGAAWHYNHAIIGGRDLVFPSQQQYAAWKGVSQTVIADMAHFPFFHFSTLQELLACFRK